MTSYVGGLLSAALSVGSRPPGVTWHLVLWSPDFPLAGSPKLATGDCLADSLHQPTLTDRIALPGWKFGRKTGHHPGSERLSASVELTAFAIQAAGHRAGLPEPGAAPDRGFPSCAALLAECRRCRRPSRHDDEFPTQLIPPDQTLAESRPGYRKDTARGACVISRPRHQAPFRNQPAPDLQGTAATRWGASKNTTVTPEQRDPSRSLRCTALAGRKPSK